MNTVIRTVSPLLVVSGAALESAVLIGHPPISAGGRDLMIGMGVSLVVVGLIARIAGAVYRARRTRPLNSHVLMSLISSAVWFGIVYPTMMMVQIRPPFIVDGLLIGVVVSTLLFMGAIAGRAIGAHWRRAVSPAGAAGCSPGSGRGPSRTHLSLRSDPTVKETSMDNDVRALREAKGLTQAQLGQELGVSRQSVNSIEKGKYDPSLPLAIAIARYFDSTVEEIFHA